MSRLMALALAFLLLAAPLAAQAETFTMMGLEQGDAQRDWSQNLFFSRMEALTGIQLTFDQYTDAAAYKAAKDAAFSGGTLPDVLFKANLTPQEEMDYLAAGKLVDLAPYLEEHAPNLYAILQARPDWRAIITQPDGAIASLPVLNNSDRQAALWINQSWLNALELDMPTDIESYTEVLRAFRDRDPNGNNRQDEEPLSLIGAWEAKFLLHAWGLVPNDYNIFVDDSGTVHFAPFEPVYYDFVDWLRMAQAEGLLSSDAFRMPQSARTSSMNEQDAEIVYGSFLTLAPFMIIDMDKTTEYAVMLPLSYNGKQVYRRLLSGVGRGAFAITSACDDVPAMLGWVDTLYTEAGGRLAFAGEEGSDYTLAEDGTWHWNTNDDYYALQDIITNSTIGSDSMTPGLEPAAFMRNSEISADNYARRQVDTLRDYLVDPFPVVWPTNPERAQKIADLQEALATHLDVAIANFALGKEELTEATWQALLDELRGLGADEFVALWQEVYDEYTATQAALTE